MSGLERSEPGWAILVAVVLQLLQVLSLFPWLVMAGLSVMAFDAPGSSGRWQPWAFVLAVWSYPAWILAAGIVSWVLIARGRRYAAMAVAAALTLPGIAGAVLLLS